MKRLFIAIKIPVDNYIKESINSFKFTHKEENIKWVELHNLHLTLLFLGDTEEDQIPTIIKNLERLQERIKSFRFNLKGLGIFSSVQNPRVLWIGINPIDDLKLLKEQINESLMDLDIQLKNEKDFRPHLTIARLKRLVNKNKFKNTLSFNKHTMFKEVIVNNFTLFQSTLTPKGPIYKSLQEFYLR